MTLEYRVVVLGAGGVGKSCLTAQFVQNRWIDGYDPTIEDSYRKQVEVDGRQYILEILDTAGTEQFTALRELYIKSGHGFLLTFSLTSPSSFKEVFQLRQQILQIKDTDDVPIVICANKADLDEDRAISKSRIQQLARAWRDVPHFETSAKMRLNVDNVFMSLAKEIIKGDEDQLADDKDWDWVDGDLEKIKCSRFKKGCRRCVIL